MPQPLDPYRDWLGVQSRGQKPNLYELLGLKPFESDPTAIATAADRARGRLRQVQPGPHLSELRELAAEIVAAKERLLDPTRKQQYDQQLRSGGSASKIGTSPKRATPLPTVAAAPADPLADLLPPSAARKTTANSPASPSGQGLELPSAAATAPVMPPASPSAAVHTLRRRRRNSGAAAIAIASALIVVVGGGLYVYMTQADGGKPIAQAPGTNPVTNPDAPPPTTAESGNVTSDKNGGSSTDSSRSQGDHSFQSADGRTAQPVALDTPSQEDPADVVGNPDTAKLEGPLDPRDSATPMPDPSMDAAPEQIPEPEPVAQIDPAKAAQFQEKLTGVRAALSKRDFEAARRLLTEARPLIQGDEQAADLGRHEALTTYVTGFWDAVAKGLGRLQALDELTVGRTIAAVVESSPEQLILRVAGGNRRYKVPDELPAGVARAVAESWFDESLPANKAYIAAFLAVDPRGDAADARKLWEEAALGGIDVSDLLTFLDDRPTSDGPRRGPAIASAPSMAPPDKQQLAAAQQAFQTSHGDRIAAATSVPKKAELAGQLLQEASAASEAATKVVLLEKSRELAAAGQDAETLVAAIDAQVAITGEEPLKLKVEALSGMTIASARNARPAATVMTAVMDEALAAEQYELAAKLGQKALTVAQRAGSAELLRGIAERNSKALAGRKQMGSSNRAPGA